jgi:hypothetical protein
MLKPGGYLAIADLCTEDGSFHGDGFHGHRGFDPAALAAILEKIGFSGIKHNKVYIIDKKITENKNMNFDVFLMTATRS